MEVASVDPTRRRVLYPDAGERQRRRAEWRDAFDALPQDVKAYLSRRLEQVLSGNDTSADFAHLSAADRLAIRAILEATKPALLRG